LSARNAFATAAGLSGFINLLMLSGPLFMLQVYDRVLPSHSVPTLEALVLLIIGLYASQAALEAIRSRLFARIGRHVDAELGVLAFDVNLRGAAAGARSASPFRDLEQLRGFLAGGGPSAIFDLPWMPVYLAMLFGLHPWLGVLGLAGAGILATLTVLADMATKPHQKRFAERSAEASGLSEAARRGAEVISAMGMGAALGAAWRERNREASADQLKASDVGGGFSGTSRFVRMSLQSMVLALGAWLVMSGKATGGVMIASSITLGRALAPVELALTHWRGFVGTRQAYARLTAALGQAAAPTDRIALPRPTRELVVEHLFAGAPGSGAPIVKDISFSLQAGDVLAVIGPSGAGKSTLLRALLGLWPPQRGAVRLDGSLIEHFAPDARGAWTGYLPQTAELFAGTVGRNIGRLDPQATSEAVLEAAQAAFADGMIRGLADGFETEVGEGGARLSAGQRQRVGLARALFGAPFLVALDEPNSNLDADGEAALARAIAEASRRGAIVIMVAHRPSAVQVANKVLVMADGQQKAFGPRDDVLKRVLAPPADSVSGGGAPAQPREAVA